MKVLSLTIDLPTAVQIAAILAGSTTAVLVAVAVGFAAAEYANAGKPVQVCFQTAGGPVTHYASRRAPMPGETCFFNTGGRYE